MDNLSENQSKSKTLLNRIANIVGCSVEDFFISGNGKFDEISTLLNVWSSIDDAQDRAKVINFARNVSIKATGLKATLDLSRE